MDEKLFWEMHADGRLASLAEDNPLEFYRLREEIIESVVVESELNGNSQRQCADELDLKLLWDTLTFEKRSSLASENPDVFKRNTRRVIEANARLIGNKDEEKMKRVNQLQWRIDREVGRHTNPLGACIAVNRMMCESMWGKNGLSDALNGLVTGPESNTEESSSTPTCTVLTFERRNE